MINELREVEKELYYVWAALTAEEIAFPLATLNDNELKDNYAVVCSEMSKLCRLCTTKLTDEAVKLYV